MLGIYDKFFDLYTIIDDMRVEMSKKTLQIHVVFDTYKSSAIKNDEWYRRSSGEILFRATVIFQKIKQWNQFLFSGENKMQLVSFTVNQ